MAFSYGADTRLDRVVLADATEIRYHYEKELMPVSILANGHGIATYQWQDMFTLVRHTDALHGLTHEFVYAKGRAPVQVIVSGSKEAIHAATGLYLSQLRLDIFTDQVDSVRVIALPDGRFVKSIEYDAFGNIVADTRPEWHFPLGFACGLYDRFTQFVRFGFRDYDSQFGRFTAKDPAFDMRGDGDLYDYCVDDPVGRFDPTGLWAWLKPFSPSLQAYALGKAGRGAAELMASGGIWLAGQIGDGAEKLFTGKTDGKASKGAEEAIKLLKQRRVIERKAGGKAAEEVILKFLK